MPVFVDDPLQLSKARLKSDLIAHNVELPPTKSKKEVYVELHMRHVDQKNAADFSSDEEPEQNPDEEEVEDAKVLDPSTLTDDGLKAALLKHGVKAGPIVASTRSVYEKKLRNLLLSNGHNKVNGADEAALYSDSEEDGNEDNEESDIDELKTTADTADQEKSQRASASKNKNASSKRISKNVLKPSQHSRSRSTQIPSVISRTSSVDQTSALATGVSSEQQSLLSNAACLSPQNFSITQMVEELESRTSCSSIADTAAELNGSNVQNHWSQSNRPVVDMPSVDQYDALNLSPFYTPKAYAHEWRRKDPVQESFKDLLPDKDVTPTGIYATRRRPIKGAAGRPIQYVYPETPVSPTTLDRREVECRLVSLHIQIFVFLIVAVTLYLIYVCVEDLSLNPLLSLLDILNQQLDTDDTDKQDAQDFLELEN